MTYRVIQWSTGNVGQQSLRCLIEHPDLELVGLVVHSDAKAGLDAGELAGLAPVGVPAMTDVAAALELDADCVCYTATGDLRPREAIEDICRILVSGTNVVSTSVVSLCYPPAADVWMVEPIEKACAEGGVSFLTSGIDPGFANDLLPLVLTGVSNRIDTLRIQEILNYDTYDQPEVLFGTMGFGQPPETTPLLLIPGALTMAWGPIVRMIADGLGVTLDGIEEWYERWDAPVRYETAAGPIEPGTMAGLRFEVRGMIGGAARIVVEHVTRMHDDAAPDWPRGNNPQGNYHIEVTGSPNIAVDFAMEEAGDHNTGGLLVTATRIVNAIPAVVEAPPGLLSTLDLPLVTGRHLMR